MWDEIKGYVVLFVGVPLAFGALYYVIVFATTGEWPDPPRANCYVEWDGVSNPDICD